MQSDIQSEILLVTHLTNILATSSAVLSIQQLTQLACPSISWPAQCYLLQSFIFVHQSSSQSFMLFVNLFYYCQSIFAVHLNYGIWLLLLLHVFVLCFPVFLSISLVFHFILCHSHSIFSVCHLHAIKFHWLPINPAFCLASAVASRNSFRYFMLNDSVWSGPCFVAVDGVSRR